VATDLVVALRSPFVHGSRIGAHDKQIDQQGRARAQRARPSTPMATVCIGRVLPMRADGYDAVEVMYNLDMYISQLLVAHHLSASAADRKERLYRSGSRSEVTTGRLRSEAR